MRPDRKELNTVFAAALVKLVGRVSYRQARKGWPGSWLLDGDDITNQDLVYAAFPDFKRIDQSVKYAVENGFLDQLQIRVAKMRRSI